MSYIYAVTKGEKGRKERNKETKKQGRRRSQNPTLVERTHVFFMASSHDFEGESQPTHV